MSPYQPLVAALCKADGLPAPVFELRFAPPRRWRFDVAFPDAQVAIEIQGGVFTGGRHTNGARLLGEHDKLNTAAVLGWRVFYCVPRRLAETWPMVVQAVRR